ncbi:hypothetical protein K458DRAFT_107436 [Lentithecium fluviatile CBS 122367]|uniref:Uncharacterized protein n=1 Tax=Lentithecium fluviatile CBS 122367 TaxID=1168545 RepID=A0A6G1IQ78_9PLEO|nr:hypothetical protein K458DRAFT_107436 [Lentithecium fluviatile CBS 122367]
MSEFGHRRASYTSQDPRTNPMAFNQGFGASVGAGHNIAGTTFSHFGFAGNVDIGMPEADDNNGPGLNAFVHYDMEPSHFGSEVANNARFSMLSSRAESSDSTQADSDDFDPIPPPSSIDENEAQPTVKREGQDDTYIDEDGALVDADGNESEYIEQTDRKRKRSGTKMSVGSEKRNKDGMPRKSRAPRAPLRRWDENDLTKALIGIVWACGETGLQIPFDQAAQVIDNTCTASALQQAILKLHAQMIKDGKQLPKIKMHWPKKGGGQSRTVLRDSGKVPRRKPTIRRGTQSLFVTLKRAYIEADRAVLAPPHTAEAAIQMAGGATSFATNNWARKSQFSMKASHPPVTPRRKLPFSNSNTAPEPFPDGGSPYNEVRWSPSGQPIIPDAESPAKAHHFNNQDILNFQTRSPHVNSARRKLLDVRASPDSPKPARVCAELRGLMGSDLEANLPTTIAHGGHLHDPFNQRPHASSSAILNSSGQAGNFNIPGEGNFTYPDRMNLDNTGPYPSQEGYPDLHNFLLRE